MEHSLREKVHSVAEDLSEVKGIVKVLLDRTQPTKTNWGALTAGLVSILAALGVAVNLMLAPVARKENPRRVKRQCQETVWLL